MAIAALGLVGRITFNADPWPDVLPGNYGMYQQTVFSNTVPSTKQATADEVAQTAWAEADRTDAIGLTDERISGHRILQCWIIESEHDRETSDLMG
ncbi:PNPOx family protein [Salinisphaera orenii]|uniref:hypothetical protein n=1 Tax=Salinisphaera orenii TaxID=856731 RepID=UPI000DBE9300